MDTESNTNYEEMIGKVLARLCDAARPGIITAGCMSELEAEQKKEKE